MSLRAQLILSMVSALLISLILVGTLAWLNAERSVTTEMRAALDAGARMVRNTVTQLPATTDDQLYIERLIPAFDGNRHIKARLVAVNTATSAITSTMARTGNAPPWFVGFVGVAPEQLEISLPPGRGPYRAVILETDPHNEIVEVWTRARDDMFIMAFFCFATIILGHEIVGHALKPLGKLSNGIAIIGTGNYGMRVEKDGPPEIAKLAGSFNTMAEQLGQLESKNHRLTGQLLTIQEEERADLARDLHDDVGPFLFAVNVDAAAIAHTAAEKKLDGIAEQVKSIQESVTHMQRHVRAILERLRPAGLQDVGLEQAVRNLAAFWQRRHADIFIDIHIQTDTTKIGEARSAAIYRLIQESLSNAIRHGQSQHIDVVVADKDTNIVVEVIDDGGGLARPLNDATPYSFGIIGMKERVAALGGCLTVTNRSDARGAVVTATLPHITLEEAETVS